MATAYALNRAGHEVAVVDRRPGAGLETSFANGGQISASHSKPWSSPEAPRLMLKWLGRTNAPLLWRMRLDPAQWAWGLRFLVNCEAGAANINTQKNLALGLYSRSLMPQIRTETGIQYDARTQGILQIFRTRSQFEQAARDADTLTRLGCEERVLDRDACLALEPALQDTGADIVGGVHAPGDETGDAHIFTRELARVCAGRGVEFRYGISIERIEAEGGRVARVITSAGPLTADAYVM
ncbi:MAG TPA: FAD-dependent oxidoreductase, partial [Terriglobales bacterium]|nr:FAD-dependent oxidoreductase [Terriglobales bacterium]